MPAKLTQEQIERVLAAHNWKSRGKAGYWCCCGFVALKGKDAELSPSRMHRRHVAAKLLEELEKADE